MRHLSGLACAKQFFHTNHIETVQIVINEQIEGATMFGLQCGQPYYFKIEDGVLYHNCSSRRTDWVRTKFATIAVAKANGVIDLYSLQVLEHIYKESIGVLDVN